MAFVCLCCGRNSDDVILTGKKALNIRLNFKEMLFVKVCAKTHLKVCEKTQLKV